MFDAFPGQVIIVRNIGELLEKPCKMKLRKAGDRGKFINGNLLGAMLVDVTAYIHELLNIFVLFVCRKITEQRGQVVGFPTYKYKEVDQQGYKLSFVNVSKEIVDSLVDEGKVYLFQLYTKDF